MPLEAVLTNLKKFTRYRIVVQAYNRIGAGPRNEDLIISTAEDGKVSHDSIYYWFIDHICIPRSYSTFALTCNFLLVINWINN